MSLKFININKKIIVYVTCILSLYFMTACERNIFSNKEIELSTKNYNDFPIVQEGKNFKLINASKDRQIDYHYWIYDNKGNIIFEESVGTKIDFSYLTDNILRRHNGGGNVSQYQYFNIDKILKSPIYANPELVANGEIVYMTYENDKYKLIVSDLFDKNKFYKEFERDFSPVAAPYSDLLDAKFINSDKIQIIYLTGNDYKEVTEILDLN